MFTTHNILRQWSIPEGGQQSPPLPLPRTQYREGGWLKGSPLLVKGRALCFFIRQLANSCQGGSVNFEPPKTINSHSQLFTYQGWLSLFIMSLQLAKAARGDTQTPTPLVSVDTLFFNPFSYLWARNRTPRTLIGARGGQWVYISRGGFRLPTHFFLWLRNSFVIAVIVSPMDSGVGNSAFKWRWRRGN